MEFRALQRRRVKKNRSILNLFNLVKGASLVAHLVKNLPVMQETLVWFLGQEFPWRRDRLPTPEFLGFPGGSVVKNLPVMPETCVRFPGRGNPLEESIATYSSILAWRIPMDRGAWWATVHVVTKSRTRLSDFTHSLILLYETVFLSTLSHIT